MKPTTVLKHPVSDPDINANRGAPTPPITQSPDSARISQSSSHASNGQMTTSLGSLNSPGSAGEVQAVPSLQTGLPMDAFSYSLQAGEQGGASGVTAKTSVSIKNPSIREKVLRVFAKTPGIQNSTIVSRYVKDVRTKNAELLTQFISSRARAGELDEQKMLAAIEALHIPAGHKLDVRDFELILDVISKFDGVGDAKPLPRKLQINIWPYENMGHPGHASMTVQHASLEGAAGNIGYDPTTHISWWPGEEVRGFPDNVKRVPAAPIDSQGNGGSYMQDAAKEISERSQEKLDNYHNVRRALRQGGIKHKLREGLDLAITKMASICRGEIEDRSFVGKSTTEIQQQLVKQFFEETTRRRPSDNIVVLEKEAFVRSNAEKLANILLEEIYKIPEGMEKGFGEEEEEMLLARVGSRVLANVEVQASMEKTVQSILEKAPYFQPRARQEIDSGSWFVSAEKIFLPLRGAQEQKPFSFFGIDEQGVMQEWERVQQGLKDHRMGYRFVSKTENCASVVINALLAGGAEAYVPFNASLFAETPNDVQKYVQALQVRIDDLNEKNKKVREFYQREQQRLGTGTVDLRMSGASAATMLDGFNEAVKAMPSAERKRFSALQKVMNGIPAGGMADKDLIHHGIALVEASSKLLADSASWSSASAASQALFWAAAMQSSLEKRMQMNLEAAAASVPASARPR